MTRWGWDVMKVYGRMKALWLTDNHGSIIFFSQLVVGLFILPPVLSLCPGFAVMLSGSDCNLMAHVGTTACWGGGGGSQRADMLAAKWPLFQNFFLHVFTSVHHFESILPSQTCTSIHYILFVCLITDDYATYYVMWYMYPAMNSVLVQVMIGNTEQSALHNCL